MINNGYHTVSWINEFTDCRYLQKSRRTCMLNSSINASLHDIMNSHHALIFMHFIISVSSK